LNFCFYALLLVSLGKSFCRRERDHSEAERAQHIQQIHDLQEHIQEKDRQLIELQEQVGCLYLYNFFP
jgi:thioredoxin-related protein